MDRPRRETPTPRTNPSGKRVWVARWTDRDGKFQYAGTFALKGPCRAPVEGSWHGKKWVGCCAQHAIDAAYDRHYGGASTPDLTVGEYDKTWLKRHPRTKRTDAFCAGAVRAVLDVKLERRAFKDWPMREVRRRQAIDLLDHMLRVQGRAAKGAQNILRVLSAMWTDALDDDRAELNPFMGVKVRRDDPRVQKAPRHIAVWSWDDMRRFTRAAGEHEPMLRVISDCGLRLGEVLPLERGDLMVNGCDTEKCQVDVPHLHVTKTTWRQQVDEGTKEDRLRAAQGTVHVLSIGRVVPVADDLLDLLLATPRRIDTTLLFPGRTGSRWKPTVGVWGEGYWYKRVWWPTRSRVKGMEKATPHEFRHSWISHLRAAGVDPADLAAMSGHTVETATRHYTHALGRSFDAARKAIGQ